jgi:glutamyl-tRNA synthetase
VAGDVLDYRAFFQPDDQVAYDEAAFEKRLRKPPEAARLLSKFREELARTEPFDATALEQRLQAFAQAEGIKNDQIIHALRVAVTGKAVGFGLFESLAILGRQSCLARIDRTLGVLKSSV